MIVPSHRKENIQNLILWLLSSYQFTTLDQHILHIQVPLAPPLMGILGRLFSNGCQWRNNIIKNKDYGTIQIRWWNNLG